MPFEHRPNTGSLFQNDRKKTEQHPDWKGSALIDGVEHWVSLWFSKTKGGKPVLNLRFNKKEDAPETSNATTAPGFDRYSKPQVEPRPELPLTEPATTNSEVDDDDIPF